MSAGSPSGAPLSTHAASVATSSSVSDMSFLNSWIPISFSTNQGGIAPATSRRPVLYLIRVAYLRATWYVSRDIGAMPPPARWQRTQFS